MKNWRETLRINAKLLFGFAAAVTLLILMHGYLGSSAPECLGVADSKETIVAYDLPVVVKKIFVIPGQSVKKGDPLIEVDLPEVNIKMLEIKTQIQALEAEQGIRQSLMGALPLQRKKLNGKKREEALATPIGNEILGLKEQLSELRKLQSQSVKFAQESGMVSTIAFKVNEQVPPFQSILSIIPPSPNLAFGFVHEARALEFKLGDEVVVEATTGPARATEGKIVSLGNRITQFPMRLQGAGANLSNPQYWGREVVVSLPGKNELLFGEKVRIVAKKASSLSDFSDVAFADVAAEKTDLISDLSTVAKHLEFEASGLLFDTTSGDLMVASDEVGPQGSPFWTSAIDNVGAWSNLSIPGMGEVKDVESLVMLNNKYYAMSSMGRSKSGKTKNRDWLIRFDLENGNAKVDRAFKLRNILISSLQSNSFLADIHDRLDEELDVEAFTLDQNDAYVILKAPLMKDGASPLIRIKNLAAQIENGKVKALETEVVLFAKLRDPSCGTNLARASDLLIRPKGLILLSRCENSKSGKNLSQVWWLGDLQKQPVLHLLKTFREKRFEGISIDVNSKSLYFSADKGSNKGSDLYLATYEYDL